MLAFDPMGQGERASPVTPPLSPTVTDRSAGAYPIRRTLTACTPAATPTYRKTVVLRPQAGRTLIRRPGETAVSQAQC